MHVALPTPVCLVKSGQETDYSVALALSVPLLLTGRGGAAYLLYVQGRNRIFLDSLTS